MTISSQISRVTYMGDGATMSFPTTFYFLSNAHVYVTHIMFPGSPSPVYTQMIEGTDYILTGVGQFSGGVVTTAVVLPATEAIEIRRVLPITQPDDWISYDAFKAETLEKGLDRLTMIAQQLDERLTIIETTPADQTTISLVNVGTGAGWVYRDQVSNVFAIRKIKAGLGMTVVNDGDDILVTATGGGSGGGLAPDGNKGHFHRGDETWSNILEGDMMLDSSSGLVRYQLNHNTAAPDARLWQIMVETGATERLSIIATNDARDAHGVGMAFVRNANTHTLDYVHVPQRTIIGPYLAGYTDDAGYTQTVNGDVKLFSNTLWLSRKWDSGSTGFTIKGEFWEPSQLLWNRVRFESQNGNSPTYVTCVPGLPASPYQYGRAGYEAYSGPLDYYNPVPYVRVWVDGIGGTVPPACWLQSRIEPGGTGAYPLGVLPLVIGTISHNAIVITTDGSITLGGDGRIDGTGTDLNPISNIRLPYMPTVNGTPTMTPTAKGGFAPFLFDRSTNKLWMYNAGWKSVTLT